MRGNNISRFAAIVLAGICAIGVAVAQQPMGHEESIAQPTPLPLPTKPPPSQKDVPLFEGILTQSDAPWELAAEILAPLTSKAAIYAEYTNRFTCDENARLASYDKTGGVSSENIRDYGYLLLKDVQNNVQEFRQRITKSGELRPGEVNDSEKFPPAYAWVFLFSNLNEPYFSYRFVADRFDGFDWVYEIQFKGSHRFTDGKDIRQWEGVALVDAVTFTPIEIRAEPVGQRERIDSMYREYNSSFNVMGMRTAPKPLGYRAEIQFRHRKDSLTFPTQVRYDTFKAVGVQQVVPTNASVRTYSKYRIYQIETKQDVGGKVGG